MEYEKPNLLIRTDASAQIGLGHLIRSVSLAAMLKQYFNIEFFCKHIPPKLENELQTYKFSLHKISNESEFLEALSPGHVVVLDGYHFNLEYQKRVKSKGTTLICIDDLAEDEFIADLIINQSPGVQKSCYHALPETKYALGPDYALLRPSFLQPDKSFSLPKGRKNLLICFGGSDVQNLTKKTVKLALDFKEFDKITIITGSEYRHQTSLNKTLMDVDICEYHHAVNEKKMASLMLDSDAAIVPASGILFEALATKNIVISGMYIENQKRNYEAFKKMNAIIDAGRFCGSEIEHSMRLVQQFKPVDVVDGKSPDRLLAAVKGVVNRKRD